MIRCASIVLCLLIPSVGLSQNNRTDSFRALVKRLPNVDRIEIIPVKPLLNGDVKTADCREQGRLCAPDTFPYELGTVKTIVGEDATKFAALWRALEKDPLRHDKCFTPDHILRFFQGENLVLETQVCALSRKITLPRVGVVSVAGSNKLPYYRFREALIPDSTFAKDFENSKRLLMPKVGTEITVIGLVVGAKAGLTIAYDEGHILLSHVDLAEENRIQNLGCHVALKVTGKLQYNPPPRNAVSTEQSVPELFYIKSPKIEVLRVERPRTAKRSKNR